jgi:hypothetical protein
MFNQIKAQAQALKTKAQAAKDKYITEEYKAQAKELGNKTLQFAKDNPTDIMVGIITLMVIDMDSSIEAIEESSEISAFVDADEYINYR